MCVPRALTLRFETEPISLRADPRQASREQPAPPKRLGVAAPRDRERVPFIIDGRGASGVELRGEAHLTAGTGMEEAVEGLPDD
jgi:hypothetical protein